ncbi:hypothetical protein AB3U99_03775 [Niallia sp. JL1B1071]|uniref:hypothetical protein n=1 Tax=Niallia tiangongensis TaxID=3237105 RepID=UPI0037DD497E
MANLPKKIVLCFIVIALILSISLPNLTSAAGPPPDEPVQMTQFLQMRANPYIYLNQETGKFSLKSGIDSKFTVE